jgi:hypothetical protein
LPRFYIVFVVVVILVVFVIVFICIDGIIFVVIDVILGVVIIDEDREQSRWFCHEATSVGLGGSVGFGGGYVVQKCRPQRTHTQN